jgi:chromosome segregation ATPase
MPRGRKKTEPMPNNLNDRIAWYDKQIEEVQGKIDALKNKKKELENKKKGVQEEINAAKYKKLIAKIEASNLDIDQVAKMIDEKVKG